MSAELPRMIGFRMAGDEGDLWAPRSNHAWPGEPAGWDSHVWHAACAICQFGAIPEARDAVLAALASHTEGDRKFCDTLAPKGGSK